MTRVGPQFKAQKAKIFKICSRTTVENVTKLIDNQEGALETPIPLLAVNLKYQTAKIWKVQQIVPKKVPSRFAEFSLVFKIIRKHNVATEKNQKRKFFFDESRKMPSSSEEKPPGLRKTSVFAKKRRNN